MQTRNLFPLQPRTPSNPYLRGPRAGLMLPPVLESHHTCCGLLPVCSGEAISGTILAMGPRMPLPRSSRR